MKKQNIKLPETFFRRDALKVAPSLLGKYIVRRYDDGTLKKFIITETEAYRGEEDLACHACKGRTKRTDIMYHPGGVVYVYLIYGMYWMINFVTGKKEHPQAVLIRAVEGYVGPGKVGRLLQLDKSFYGEDLSSSKRIWVEESGIKGSFKTDKRVGIDYAGPIWRDIHWRFILSHD